MAAYGEQHLRASGRDTPRQRREPRLDLLTKRVDRHQDDDDDQRDKQAVLNHVLPTLRAR
jgi:hypothetical protein